MKRFAIQCSTLLYFASLFCFIQAVASAQQPTPTPPPIVYKLRGVACHEAYGGVGGSTECTPIQETTNANLARSIGDTFTDASINATVLPIGNTNILQADMATRLQRLHAGGPAFITSAKSFLDVEVYVKDTPTDLYTIIIDDGSSSHNQHTRPPTSGGFGCPCGSQNALGSATLTPGLTLHGTSSQLGSQIVNFPEYPGVNYRLAYQRSPNDWDYVTAASGGINDWDFDADLWADAFLSLHIFATASCPTRIQLICRPISPYGEALSNLGLACPAFIAKHCYFLISFPDGHKETISAFPSLHPLPYGTLTPKRNGDPITPPNGCISDDSDPSRPFCKDLPLSNPCDAYEKLLLALQRGEEGSYSLADNNSNTWVNRRLTNPLELGIPNCPLPPSAPTNVTEYRTQRDKIRGILSSQCRLTEEIKIEQFLQSLWPFF